MIQSKKVIGVTGGIATGKSTLMGLIKNRGYRIIDADSVAHKLMMKNRLNYRRIVSAFGREILLESGEIDRKKLRNIVFSDRDKLELLNRSTHSAIQDAIETETRLLLSIVDTVFVDIPLLVEQIVKGSSITAFDEIWLVYLDRETQTERLMARDSVSREDAEKAIAAQMDIDEKRKYATRVFCNGFDREGLERQLDVALKELR